MFRLTRERPTFVRILDTPLKLIIEPTFIATPLPNGQLLIVHGNFDCTSDADVTLKIQRALDHPAVA